LWGELELAGSFSFLSATNSSMNYQLVYDAITTSDAPRSAYGLGLVALALFSIWAAWLKTRGHALHAGIWFLGIIVLVLFAIGIGSQVEQRYLANRTDTRTIEGPIMGHWKDRVRRAGSNNSYWEWEGFYVQNVPFSYTRNLEQNYFHNAGSRSLELKDGMRVRVTYIEEQQDGKPRNHILRFEHSPN